MVGKVQPCQEGRTMWMKSRFAQWEVEGQVQEQVKYALHEAEHVRLVRTAQRARAQHTPGRVLGNLSTGLVLELPFAFRCVLFSLNLLIGMANECTP